MYFGYLRGLPHPCVGKPGTLGGGLSTMFTGHVIISMIHFSNETKHKYGKAEVNCMA
jgi:hypothetical protein